LSMWDDPIKVMKDRMDHIAKQREDKERAAVPLAQPETINI
jgi:hypothetical protein